MDIRLAPVWTFVMPTCLVLTFVVLVSPMLTFVVPGWLELTSGSVSLPMQIFLVPTFLVPTLVRLDVKLLTLQVLTIVSVNFFNADLSDSNFYGTAVTACKLQNSKLYRTIFDNGSWSGNNVDGARLNWVSMRNMDLRYVDLGPATMEYANFTGSNLVVPICLPGDWVVLTSPMPT